MWQYDVFGELFECYLIVIVFVQVGYGVDWVVQCRGEYIGVDWEWCVMVEEIGGDVVIVLYWCVVVDDGNEVFCCYVFGQYYCCGWFYFGYLYQFYCCQWVQLLQQMVEVLCMCGVYQYGDVEFWYLFGQYLVQFQVVDVCGEDQIVFVVCDFLQYQVVVQVDMVGWVVFVQVEDFVQYCVGEGEEVVQVVVLGWCVFEYIVVCLQLLQVLY